MAFFGKDPNTRAYLCLHLTKNHHYDQCLLHTYFQTEADEENNCDVDFFLKSQTLVGTPIRNHGIMEERGDARLLAKWRLEIKCADQPCL